jgi:hypothetical protein
VIGDHLAVITDDPSWVPAAGAPAPVIGRLVIDSASDHPSVWISELLLFVP